MLADDRLLAASMKKTDQAADSSPSLVPTAHAREPFSSSAPTIADEATLPMQKIANAEGISAPTFVVSGGPSVSDNGCAPPAVSSQTPADQANEEPKPRPSREFTVKEQRRVVLALALAVFCASAFGSIMSSLNFDESIAKKDDKRSTIALDLLQFGPLGGLVSVSFKKHIAEHRVSKAWIKGTFFWFTCCSLVMIMRNSESSWLFRWMHYVTLCILGAVVYFSICSVKHSRPSAKHGLEIGILYASMRLGQATSARYALSLLDTLGSWRKVQLLLIGVGIVFAIFIVRFIPQTRFLDAERDALVSVWEALAESDREKEGRLSEKDAYDSPLADEDTEKQLPSAPQLRSSPASEQCFTVPDEIPALGIRYSEFLRRPQVPSMRSASLAVVPAFLSFWVFTHGFKSHPTLYHTPKYFPHGENAKTIAPYYGDMTVVFALGNAVGALLAGYACDHVKSRRTTRYYPESILKVAYPGLALAVPVSIGLAMFSPYLAKFVPGIHELLLQSKYLVTFCTFWSGVGSFSSIIPLIVYFTEIFPHRDDLRKVLAGNTWIALFLPSIPYIIAVVATKFAKVPRTWQIWGENWGNAWAGLVIVSCLVGFGTLRRIVRKADVTAHTGSLRLD